MLTNLESYLYGLSFDKIEKINSNILLKDFSEEYFWLGIFDNIGSLGLTKENKPFVTLAIKNEKIKNSLLFLLKEKFNIIKNINPNKRDNIYNITLYNEDAILFINYLYNDKDSIFSQNKYNIFLKIKDWIRPQEQPKKGYKTKRWTEEEINYILSHTIEESIENLNRTKASIVSKLYQLRNK